MLRNNFLLWSGTGFIFYAKIMEIISQKFGIDVNSLSLIFISFCGLYFVGVWVYYDSMKHNEIYKPFDYGYLIYIFLLFYLPYYIGKTRGKKGVFIVLAVMALYLAMDFSQGYFHVPPSLAQEEGPRL